MYQILCTVNGLVTGMQDRFYNPEELDLGKGKRRGKDSWKKELPLKAYVDKKGMYFPVDNIRMMLIGNKHRRGSAQILGSEIQKSKGTMYKSMATGCIWIVGTKDTDKVHIEPIRKTYDDYDERSFINATGSRSLTRRPLFKTPWSLTFIIQVTDNNIDETFVRSLFEVAGLRCGIGAYGPTFGRFVIDKWEIVK